MTNKFTHVAPDYLETKEIHTYNDFECVYEFHGAEGNDSRTYQCQKCGFKVED